MDAGLELTEGGEVKIRRSAVIPPVGDEAADVVEELPVFVSRVEDLADCQDMVVWSRTPRSAAWLSAEERRHLLASDKPGAIIDTDQTLEAIARASDGRLSAQT